MKDASEFNKIRYISAIIKNSINDFFGSYYSCKCARW